MTHTRSCAGALALLLLAATGCSTMNTARPLEPGQHAVGVTAGGPLIELFGLVFPLPTSDVEGRSGLTYLAGRPLDANYGLHLTSTLFGVAGVHAGASYLLLRQNGPLPALSVANRLYLFTNWPDWRKPEQMHGFWALDQLEATLSYAWMGQLGYVGLAEYLDLGHPGLYLAPFAGLELSPGLDWLAFQVEGRWLAPWVDNTPATPKWVAPFDRGGVLVTGGVILRFDLAEREEGVS